MGRGKARALLQAAVGDVVFVEAEVVADLVEEGGLDLFDELLLAAGGALEVVLEEMDGVRQIAAAAAALLGAGGADVQTEDRRGERRVVLQELERGKGLDEDREGLQLPA